MRRFWKIAVEWGQIGLGTLVLALGINLFLLPNQISAGGVSAIGTVLLYWFGIRISVTNFVANLLLLAIGFRALGGRALLKTAGGILLLSFFLELTAQIPVYTEDLLLSSLAGGIAIGAGVGLVVRRGASTGGSDFAALILHRFFPHISLADTIFWMDLGVILFSGIVFGSLRLTGYSALCMYLTSKIADAIITAGRMAKQMRIFSVRAEEIAVRIMERLARGVSAIPYTGMYSKKDGQMLLCVVSPKELPTLFELVREIDIGAFVVISDVREVHGKGFSE